MKTLSIQRPRPSIEMRMPASLSVVVKAKLVNWVSLIDVEDVWLAVPSHASSNAATQNSVSIVFDSRQASTLRLVQSMIASR
jgi:hypothetical protein